ncbi:MAG TPA: type II toxin-antitoxin system death-on-curing family toxin [Bacteroidales bacterium]|nr:type II toxin-antitoxin system death-on-curing family toxin [Bacteroidales bacterium]
MINIEIVKYFHSILIDEFGGSTGIRDLNALNAAIQRPYSTFDGKDLYPTIYDKAAALVESLVKNHAFIDGNKRIGYVMLRFFLIESGYDLSASQTDKYNFIIEISKGNLDFDNIKKWIVQNAQKI